jgi:hypothetical protein
VVKSPFFSIQLFLEVDHGGEAGRDWIHVARTRCDVRWHNLGTRLLPYHCRDQRRRGNQVRLAFGTLEVQRRVGSPARVALLLDRPPHRLVPSWPRSTSQGSAERQQREGARTVDPTCRWWNVSSATRLGTTQGIATTSRRASHPFLGVMPSGYAINNSTSSFPFRYAPSTSACRTSKSFVWPRSSRAVEAK